MARRTKEEAEQTRAAILGAAIEVFLKKGVTRTTLQEIAEEAGVTRGAIYHNFANKGELLSALLESATLPDEIMEAYWEQTSGLDPLEMLAAWSQRAMEHIIPDERGRKIFTILYHRCDRVEELSPVIQKESEKSARVEGMFRKQFSEARRQGILRDDVTPEQAAHIFSSVTKGMYIRSLLIPEIELRNVPFMIAVDAVLKGLRKTVPA